MDKVKESRLEVLGNKLEELKNKTDIGSKLAYRKVESEYNNLYAEKYIEGLIR